VNRCCRECGQVMPPNSASGLIWLLLAAICFVTGLVILYRGVTSKAWLFFGIDGALGLFFCLTLFGGTLRQDPLCVRCLNSTES
jgi:membrane associated rhomboid family serine protease